jgi:hypothetical protein
VAIYIIAGLIAIVVLMAAYRTIGRPAAPVTAPAALLRAVLNTAQETLSSLGDDAPSGDARSSRRRLDGCALQLERLDPATLSDDASATRRLLGEAVEELNWAFRLRESSGAAQPGMRRAIAELRASGEQALSDAAVLLAASVAAEEGDGPP